MKTIFAILKFGHHTENSLTPLYGTRIVSMKRCNNADGIPKDAQVSCWERDKNSTDYLQSPSDNAPRD